MINKQSLWFVTLFSLIVVLGVYYFSTDQSIIPSNKTNNSKTIMAKNVSDNNIDVLKITSDEATVGKIDDLQNILLDSDATLEEKNDAYDELEVISSNRSKENELSTSIKKEFKYDNFIKIDNNHVSIVISSKDHSNEIANSIIRKVQEKFNEDKYITVKFNQ